MAGTLASAAPASTGSWIRRFHPAPDARTRLVCLPHAGGSATFYFPVSRAMSPGVDVLAVQYPGRQDRRTEPCVEDLGRLAELVTEALRPWLDRPFALFGHSMGATVAFEVARRLEDDGVSPLAVFASGRRAPSCHRDERVHLADDRGLVAELTRLSGTNSQMLDDGDALRMILPAVRADYRAAETYRYRPGPPLACPIVALTGDADPHVTLDEARSWAAHTTADFDLAVYPGGHFFLTDHATAVMRRVTRQLDAAPPVAATVSGDQQKKE
jgi:pyochelin biosynthetic protein PchC